MEYAFLDDDDARILDYAAKQVEGGVAAAVRSTGYAVGSNEVLELALVRVGGDVLFDRRVCPQNVEDWAASEASGGITPADVIGLPELYQFEDQVIAIVEAAPVLVAAHLPYVKAMVEASWVTMPDFEGLDLVDLFCASHGSSTYPGEPAAAASLEAIAAYYGVAYDDTSAAGAARTVAESYRALVEEHVRARDAKGQAHWDAYRERLRAGEERDERAAAVLRMREHRFNQMNALLWVAGAIIFVSLIIQLYQRGGDMGFMVVAAAAAVFCAARAVVNFRK